MAKLILIIDDSLTMLMSIQQTLEMAGFDVKTAQDGDEALDKLTEGLKPDLVITDINMPRMNGLEFIKKAREIIRFTPILALTTESKTSKKEEAKSYGATGWLLKPVDSESLIKVVKQVVPGA